MISADDFNAEWHADRRARRLAAIRAQRPPRLRGPGRLLPEIEAWSRNLRAGTAGNLVIVGGVGVGKTWSVWEALERAVMAGYLGKTLVASAAAWQDAIAPPVDRMFLQAMRDADVLAFDDLGSSRINEWQRECLLTVVDERWQHARPVALTTNLAELDDALGDRLASRLADGATVVAIDGEDRRGLA